MSTWTSSGAIFSPCKKYRYKLWRVWNETLPTLYFILMNPSVADEVKNDPTIERCCRRAERLGFGGVTILNCGGIRETDSRRAWADDDPIGPENLEVIREEIHGNPEALFIAEWGNPASERGCDIPVLDIFKATGTPLYCLGTNANGSPKHPLYVGYDINPVLYLPGDGREEEGIHATG